VPRVAGDDDMPHLAGVEHRTVRAGGLSFHVAEAGDGPPLVLLHGWPQHWWMWRRLIPGLSERFRVICPDLRGFGWSEAPRFGYDKETLADDVALLIDALGLDRVRLAGHDWGGYAGFLLCLRHPALVERYLALNIVHPWPPLRPAAVPILPRLWYQAVLAAPGVGTRILRDVPGFVRALLRFSAREGTWSHTDLDSFAERLRDPDRAAASAAVYRTFLLHELLPLLRGRYRAERLETPTLLLFGDRDLVQPVSLLEGYEDHAPAMEVEIVPGVGHFIAEEAPETVLERALAFFDDRLAVAAAGNGAGRAEI
jgi:pimeloyl-ACP methyl ester carboxylesterase